MEETEERKVSEGMVACLNYIHLDLGGGVSHVHRRNISSQNSLSCFHVVSLKLQCEREGREIRIPDKSVNKII